MKITLNPNLRASMRKLYYAGLFLIISSAGICYSFSAQRRRQSPKTSANTSRVVTLSGDPATFVEFDFGTMNSGDRSEYSITISNQTRQNLEIARLEYSCPCVKLENVKGVIEPGNAVQGSLILDMAAEPLFHGDLAAEVSAYDPSGNHLFQLVVAASVHARESIAAELSLPQPVPMPSPANPSGEQP
jgi:hypothetical protein